MIEFQLMLSNSHQTENAPDRKPISPPPFYGSASSARSFRYRSDSFQQSINSYSGIETVSQAAPSSSSLYNETVREKARNISNSSALLSILCSTYFFSLHNLTLSSSI